MNNIFAHPVNRFILREENKEQCGGMTFLATTEQQKFGQSFCYS